jgi:hypothetical protein
MVVPLMKENIRWSISEYRIITVSFELYKHIGQKKTKAMSQLQLLAAIMTNIPSPKKVVDASKKMILSCMVNLAYAPYCYQHSMIAVCQTALKNAADISFKLINK